MSVYQGQLGPTTTPAYLFDRPRVYHSVHDIHENPSKYHSVDGHGILDLKPLSLIEDLSQTRVCSKRSFCVEKCALMTSCTG